MYDLSALGVKDIIARVDALREEVDAMRPLDPDQAGKAMQRLRLEWTYHSNAIEGNSLTYGETRALLLHGVTAAGKPLKDHLDIKGHKEALDYLERFVQNGEPLTLTAIREMHKLLLGDPYEVPAETSEGQPTRRTITPGDFKTQPNHVTTATGETHYYARPEEVPACMADLVDWQRETWPRVEAGEVQPIPFASDLHHRFAAIHPFDDGNGRMARLLMNLVLMRAGYVPAVLRQENRPAYYGALAQADGGDLGALVQFVASELESTLELYLRALRGEPDPDAFSKRVALLRLQVETVGATTERSNENMARIGRHFIVPLLVRLAERSTEIAIVFDRYNDHGSLGYGGHLVVRDDLDEMVSNIARGFWEDVSWWRDFTGYLIGFDNKRSAQLNFSAVANSRFIEIRVGPHIRRVRYDEHIGEREAEKLADQALHSFIDGIERLHEQALSEQEQGEST